MNQYCVLLSDWLYCWRLSVLGFSKQLTSYNWKTLKTLMKASKKKFRILLCQKNFLRCIIKICSVCVCISVCACVCVCVCVCESFEQILWFIKIANLSWIAINNTKSQHFDVKFDFCCQNEVLTPRFSCRCKFNPL